jgi:hypothetical protein
MTDCVFTDIQKGREVAANIIKKLSDPINACVNRFLRKIFQLVEAYALYILTHEDDPTRVFIEMKVNQYKTEIGSVEDFAKPLKDKMFVKKMLLDHLMPNQLSSDHTQNFHSQQVGNCGQVLRSFENLMKVINEGNLRERLSIIYNFRFSCALMWDIIKIYHINHNKWLSLFGPILDIGNFESMLELMSQKLEMQMSDAINVCQTWLTKSESATVPKASKCVQSAPGVTLSLCALVYLPVSGQVLGSRVCPEGTCRRDSAEKDCSYLVPLDAVVPPLSDREKKFIDSFSVDMYRERMVRYLTPEVNIQKIENGTFEMNNVSYVPWISGKLCYSPKEESFFYQFYKLYKKPMFSGPSGTADMFMIFARYFPLSLYEKQLILLGIIAWMAVPPDHSVFEILSVIPAHKIVDYKPHDSEYKYVEDMIDHFVSNPNMPFANSVEKPCFTAADDLNNSHEMNNIWQNGGRNTNKRQPRNKK